MSSNKLLTIDQNSSSKYPSTPNTPSNSSGGDNSGGDDDDSANLLNYGKPTKRFPDDDKDNQIQNNNDDKDHQKPLNNNNDDKDYHKKITNTDYLFQGDDAQMESNFNKYELNEKWEKAFFNRLRKFCPFKKQNKLMQLYYRFYNNHSRKSLSNFAWKHDLLFKEYIKMYLNLKLIYIYIYLSQIRIISRKFALFYN